jgi:hypothetical protein
LLIEFYLQKLLDILNDTTSSSLDAQTRLINEDNSFASNDDTALAKKVKISSKIQQETAFAFLFRVKLDVNVDAPIIIIPKHSNSFDALQIDCGFITIKTSLQVKNTYYETTKNKNIPSLYDWCQLPPVIEVQKVLLSKMQISR